jgi:hypothetical protein
MSPAKGRSRSGKTKKSKRKSPYQWTIRLFVFVVVVGVLKLFVLPLLPQSNVPQISPADKATMDRAATTQGGKLLTESNPKHDPQSVISDKDVVGFLDEQEKHAGVANPGPYVVFIVPGRPVPQYGDPKVEPDAVVDVNNGVIVAMKQEFTGHRGAICTVTRQTSDLISAWPILNASNGYLRGKSMPLQVPVSVELVQALPQSFPPTDCFVYPS